MSTIVGNYQGKYTGARVDELLTRVDEGTDLVPIVEELGHKAEIDGKYPDLTSGFASQLVGRGESTPSEFGFRASGGKSILDGSARIKEMRGNAVVWNQKVNVGYVDGERIIHLNEGIPKGHVFCMQRTVSNGACWYLPSENSYRYQLAEGESGSIFTNTLEVDATYVRLYCTAASGHIRLIDLTQMFGAGNEPTTIEEYYARKPIVADENAYNEGEMIADNSTAIKSIGDNAWDEQWELGRFSTVTGENAESSTQIRTKNLIRVLPNSTYYFNDVPSMPTYDGIWIILFDNNGDVIQGFNGGDYTSDNSFICYPNTTFTTAPNAAYMRFYVTEGYGATYNNDITISLYHSGWKAEVDNVYKPYVEFTRDIDQRILDAFPNGRKPWDKVYNKNGKGYIVKGTGEVDMGSLTWWEGFNGYITSGIQSLIKPKSDNELSKSIVCSKYVVVGNRASEEGISVIYEGVGYSYNDYILILNTAYSSADELTAALQGVMLWYELANPEIIEYDEPFNLDYDIWDFGTEQAIAEAPSAPINADIIYQFNAVDMIREHENDIVALQEQIAALQTALASLTSATTTTAEE